MKATKKHKKVTSAKKTKKKGIFRGGAKNGALYAIAILAIVATVGGIMVGGAVPKISKLANPMTQADPYLCCDSGEGADCHPIMESSFVFNGDTYALLKSKIFQNDGHIVPAELDQRHGYPKSYTPEGGKIFVNTSDHTAHHPGLRYCEQGKDLIGIDDRSGKYQYFPPYASCFGILDEEIIYVCTDTPSECEHPANLGNVPFDVYYRVKDGPVVEEISTKCTKPKQDTPNEPQTVILLPTPSGTANLQLETFRVEQKRGAYHWLAPWCKPADYFYPTQKTDIHFDVNPVGEFTYTDPQYAKGGWDFTAYPDGKVVHNGQTYPYIYWDAAIPNSMIQKPKTGYSVAYADLRQFLNDLMPKLGLNEKETNDFVGYWTKQLPKANYYFIGMIPQEHINALAPLTVNPAPDSILRVTLYFKDMDKDMNIAPPQIESFTRKGFSVIEWGGLFDTQKHPGFSCLM